MIVEMADGLLQMKIIRVQIQGQGDSDNDLKRYAISLDPKKQTTVGRFISHACRLFDLGNKKYQLSIDGYAICQKDKAKVLKEDEVYRLKLLDDSLFADESSSDEQERQQLGRREKKEEKQERKQNSLGERKANQESRSKSNKRQKKIPNIKARSHPHRSTNIFEQLNIPQSSEESDPQPRKMPKINEQGQQRPKPSTAQPEKKKESVLLKKRERSASSSSESSLTPSVHQKPKQATASTKQSPKPTQNSEQRNSIQRFVCGQIHYYFSDKNYYNDNYLQMLQYNRPNYYISLACFLRFPKIKKFYISEEQLFRYLSEDERIHDRNYIFNIEEKTLRKKDLIEPYPLNREQPEQPNFRENV